MRIPLIKPYLPPSAKARVCAVLDSGFLVEGPCTAELEARLAAFTGAAHAVAMDSCTTALEVALRCLGVGPGHEVVVPDYTFPATAQAVQRAGARPVVVDVDPASMLMDLDALEAALTPGTRAVMPVSSFGNPLDWDALAALKARHGFFVVEDAACALGAEYRGRRVGVQADITVFSLHPRKFVTTARGGAATTENPEWARWMHAYKCFGRGESFSRADTRFDQPGANAMLPDVLSAIGLAQMEVAEEMLTRRLALAARYRELLAGASGVAFPTTPAGGVHSQQSFCVFVDNRDGVMATLREAGVEAQIGTYALHLHRAFAQAPDVRITGDMAGSRWDFEHCLTLPLFHEMTEAEQDEVAERLLAATAASEEA
ncbi:MAG: DegT/DnrJ/EryC1/StrS family aminotransferase [Desulfovibrionaceae bacterium]